MTRTPRSLQGHLVSLVLGLLTIVWLATAAVTWFDARDELEELLDSHLTQAAALLVVQQNEIGDGDHQIDAPTLHRYASKVAFQVYHEGRLTLRSANAPTAPLAGSTRDFVSGFRTVRIDGREWRVFATHGAEHDVQVYVGEEARSRDSILWAVLRSTLWPMAIALPLLALAVWWAVYRGVAPMRRLGRALLERRPESLERLKLDGAPSEMMPMIDALNALFGRIETLLESERRFTADAAHELRTPIAAIRAHAQVAMNEPNGEERRHALQSTLDGCDRATRLVEQLLTLSRLEADAAPASRTVDLAAIVRRVLAEVAPRAIARHQLLELDAAGPCPLAGDETLLAVLVRNLVDNAIRYSPPSVRIQVRVACDATGPRLSVEDGGPGLGEVALQRLGERFFRMPGHNESGSGLGWSIVRRIAAVHRLKIDVGRSSTLGGLAVHVQGASPVKP